MAHDISASNQQPLERPTPAQYDINWKLAIWAGILGQLLFLGFYYPVYFYYQEEGLDLIHLFGAFVFPGEPVLRTIAGLGAVMGLGVALSVGYAWVLLYILNLRSSGTTGFIYGFFVFQPIAAFVLPWTVGFLAELQGVRLNLPDVLLNQAGHGASDWDGPFLMMTAYIMYGLTVGAIYRHKLRTNYAARTVYLGG
ncbi:MAG: hypothetical protein OHK0029_25970 [Armatimonadaceae bacterium]